MPAKRPRRDRPESRVVLRLRQAPKYRAAPEYQRCARPACNQAGAGAEAMKWRRAFPVELFRDISRRALHLHWSLLLPARRWIEASHALRCQKQAGFVLKQIRPDDEFLHP